MCTWAQFLIESIANENIMNNSVKLRGYIRMKVKKDAKRNQKGRRVTTNVRLIPSNCCFYISWCSKIIGVFLNIILMIDDYFSYDHQHTQNPSISIFSDNQNQLPLHVRWYPSPCWESFAEKISGTLFWKRHIGWIQKCIFIHP